MVAPGPRGSPTGSRPAKELDTWLAPATQRAIRSHLKAIEAINQSMSLASYARAWDQLTAGASLGILRYAEQMRRLQELPLIQIAQRFETHLSGFRRLAELQAELLQNWNQGNYEVIRTVAEVASTSLDECRVQKPDGSVDLDPDHVAVGTIDSDLSDASLNAWILRLSIGLTLLGRMSRDDPHVEMAQDFLVIVLINLWVLLELRKHKLA